MDDSVRTAEEDYPITASLIFSGQEYYRWADTDKMFHATDLAQFLYLYAHYEVRDTMRAGQWRREVGEPSWSPLTREIVEDMVGKRVD